MGEEYKKYVEEIKQITSVFSKDSFVKLEKFLDLDLKIPEMALCQKFLVMTNDSKYLLRVEKSMNTILHGENYSNDEKLKLLDRFTSIRNGQLTGKTVEWIFATAFELFALLFQKTDIIRTKVQCAQYILRNNAQKYIENIIIKDLVQLVSDGKLTENEKGEIIDIFYSTHNETLRKIADNMVNNLNAIQALSKQNIYAHRQNVHDSTISESIKASLEILAKDAPKSSEKSEILLMTPLDVLEIIRGVLTERKLINEKINDALTRITTDQAYFTNTYKFRLRDILQRVWNRIINMPKDQQDEAIIRLSSELYDAGGLCSTGHMSRIVNVLSGFSEEYGGLQVVKISWYQQIEANISARIMTRIKHIQDQDFQGTILNALISTDEKEQEHYKNYVNSIRSELYNELLEEFSSVFDQGEKPLTKIDFDAMFENYMNKY